MSSTSYGALATLDFRFKFTNRNDDRIYYKFGTTFITKVLLVFLFTGINNILSAQNLVPNPGFEIYPTPQCNYVASQTAFNSYISDWTRPTEGTSDIYSTLLPQSCQLAMPVHPIAVFNEVGAKVPHSGNYFAGMAPEVNRWFLTERYREYLQTPLATPLNPGKTYCASMFVSFSTYDYANNNIGMLFLDTVTNISNDAPIFASPQVVDSGFIVDRINWVKIEGCFIASSAYQYLIIGNFSSYTESILKYELGGTSFNLNVDASYYFFDDISVEEVVITPINVSNDTTICLNTSVNLNSSGADFFWWSTTESPLDTVGIGSSIMVSPLETTDYIVHGKICNCSNYEQLDTIKVTVYPFYPMNMASDTSLCVGTSYINTLDNSIYSNVYINNVLSSNAIVMDDIGTFHIRATDINGCSVYDTVRINNFIPLPVVDIGDDRYLCFEEYIYMKDTNFVYKWQGTIISDEYTIDSPGKYWVEASNQCGIATDSINIIYRDDIFISNLITANSDGKNDQLLILGILENISGKLEVYNRWGERVYYNDNYQNDWSGDNLSDGIYYYLYTYSDCDTFKGWVEIIK